MPQNIAAAKTTLALIISSSASIIGASTSAVVISDGINSGLTKLSIGEQLNQPHEFLYLNLPIWYFFVAVFLLSAIGSLVAFFTDTLSEKDQKYQSSNGRKIGNLFIGFITGIIGTFVVLPAFTAHPPVGIMLITSLVVSFAGSVLIHNLSELKRDDELQTSVRKLIVKRLVSIINLLSGGNK
ncbi:hypothetical protein [Psychrobacter sp. I-STPA10]|uniref:hypothetical protein n=1 Tax=Psychrobacter sp. I-STPA10 TaxID=2585769 RepID=UPI001E298C70|nr:hypothetical protein [Psychrobacter sp. I-STPA10]